jgi:hypothetical protein
MIAYEEPTQDLLGSWELTGRPVETVPALIAESRAKRNNGDLIADQMAAAAPRAQALRSRAPAWHGVRGRACIAPRKAWLGFSPT